MLISLIVTFSRIHSLSINLQDVLNEHADDVTEINPHLTLVVDHSDFANINITAQKPVLAGPEVQNVTIFKSTFLNIACSEDGPLPTEAVQGVANRSVVVKSSQIRGVDGALSGALVFGLQASSLTLEHVQWDDGTNAVRFSENVAFDKTLELTINSSRVQNTTASEIWPNGGFLYLPHDQVHINMYDTSVYSSSAPNGNGAGKSGGLMYAGKNVDTIALGFFTDANRSTITFDRCHISNTSAGQSGGFIYAGKNVDMVTLNALAVFNSTALENGGSIFVDKCVVRCCKAESGMGNDVLISFKSEVNYKVKMKNFENCTSYTRGHKVTFLPKVHHTAWTNSRSLKYQSVATGIVIGIIVFLAVCTVVAIVCCRCGVCVACGCGKRKADAYQHVESQPISDSVPSQSYSDGPSPQQDQVDFHQSINNA
ncbi:hypothetical protein BLNAU_22185 [Blattamonas nauphoetae]|uniref:Right handed beta helix domain-containing protein n=1 Tax=Blattamonas nauphoetae TaxID=2049346 RepID=A0ABQ9WTR7_9EUKA|nr:hypothetical protein BLNAU_22185 [Blattamonas nauphoetae]